MCLSAQNRQECQGANGDSVNAARLVSMSESIHAQRVGVLDARIAQLKRFTHNIPSYCSKSCDCWLGWTTRRNDKRGTLQERREMAREAKY